MFKCSRLIWDSLTECLPPDARLPCLLTTMTHGFNDVDDVRWSQQRLYLANFFIVAVSTNQSSGTLRSVHCQGCLDSSEAISRPVMLRFENDSDRNRRSMSVQHIGIGYNLEKMSILLEKLIPCVSTACSQSYFWRTRIAGRFAFLIGYSKTLFSHASM